MCPVSCFFARFTSFVVDLLADLDFIPHQRASQNQKGSIVCNSNCAVIGVVVPFAGLTQFGPIDQASVTTMQAVSGAGYTIYSSSLSHFNHDILSTNVALDIPA